MPSFRYPDHWYHDQFRILCIVPGCGFVTPSEGVIEQWTQIYNHCRDTSGTEHKIMEKILQQSCCAIENCNHPAFTHTPSQRTRDLFGHEKSTHGSTDMSHICSFVRLAREGRIMSGTNRKPTPGCEKLAFDRMLDKVMALPAATIDLIFEKSGHHNPDQKSRDTMGKILTDDPLAKSGEQPPYWWPIRAEHFLWSSRPHDFDAPDPHWSTIWTQLRLMYAQGEI